MDKCYFVKNTACKPPIFNGDLTSQPSLEDFSDIETAKVLRFHKSFKQYEPTPLAKLSTLANRLGVKAVFVKDESKRFGLNAFKALGGTYAIGKYLAEKLGVDMDELTIDHLQSDETHKKTGDITFVTATDGNHGRGVAWMAVQIGQKAVVFMPKGSAEIRAENIRKTGATCIITDLNYDDAVRFANQYAEKNNGVLIQDTAWEGYENIPTWIMQGYSSLAVEALEQLKFEEITAPTHVFLQAGVGSFASAVIGVFAVALREKRPVITIVEPENAACIFESMKASDGKLHIVSGELATLMAGLACGEPSAISWPIIRDNATAAISCADYYTAKGMRLLGNPEGSDPKIISGESGAPTTGMLESILTLAKAGDSQAIEIKEFLGLNEDSVVLLISTEGDTSPEVYNKIVNYDEY